ncbi:MAG: hypothetical protein UHN59_00790 [Bacteroidales bacterium]|nr:hypothetical protein [Bacteroidales bacterium]
MKKILVILAGFMISCTSQATNTESNTETGVESDQIQMKKSQNKVIKKSIEKTDGKTLVKEYNEEGELTKMTLPIEISTDQDVVIFTFDNGKLSSYKVNAKVPEMLDMTEIEIDKNKNEFILRQEWGGEVYTFNEFGISKITKGGMNGKTTYSYKYDDKGLLLEIVSKSTTTYTYDVMSQDWTKRTGTDNKGNKTVTTRTVEYW